MTKIIRSIKKVSNVERMRIVRDEYIECSSGYRKSIRTFCEKVLQICIEMHNNKMQLAEFKRETYWETQEFPGDLTLAGMKYMSDAKTRGGHQLASKRARAVNYLHYDLAVPLEEIADQIKARGGIEKIAQLAAKESKSKLQSEKIALDKDSDHNEVIDEYAESHREIVEYDDDHDNSVSIQLSENNMKRISNYERGQRVKIIAEVVDQTLPILKVKKLVSLK